MSRLIVPAIAVVVAFVLFWYVLSAIVDGLIGIVLAVIAGLVLWAILGKAGRRAEGCRLETVGAIP